MWQALTHGMKLARCSNGKAILADVTAWCHGKLGADDITIVVARRR